MRPASIHFTRLTIAGVAITVVVCLASALPSAQSSGAQIPAPQTCELGTLRLESGQSIEHFRMTYLSFGTLNATRTNGVLQLHGLRGNRNSQTVWAGPDGAFDTHKYFVIQPDTLGVASMDPAATTSPTRSGLKMQFPRFSVRDMVHAEYRMVTQCLGLTHLVAVSGTSMGGIESLQWAVSHPRFMDAVIPIVPQAVTAKQSVFIWEAARRAIMLDPKWMNGAYPESDPPRSGVAIGLAVQTAFSSSSLGFDQDYPTRAAVLDFYESQMKSSSTSVDARDWIYRTYAIDSHNIGDTPGAGGSVAAAARTINARLLMFPNCFDQLHPPVASGVFEVAENALVAKAININDIHGHGGTAAQRERIVAEIRGLLSRIENGVPGIEGPRFPRGSSRADCSAATSSTSGDQ
jgi:homoserine O-acetyltransferase